MSTPRNCSLRSHFLVDPAPVSTPRNCSLRSHFLVDPA